MDVKRNTRSTASSDVDFHAVNAELRRRYIELETIAESSDQDVSDVLQELGRIGNRFVELNMPLAAVIANRFGPANREDCLMAGIEGLWTAFLRWDPEKAEFSTWSRPFIAGEIRRAVAFTERPGRSYDHVVQAKLVTRQASELALRLGRFPSVAEIAAETGFSEDRVEALLAADPVSLDVALSEDGATTWADRVPDPVQTDDVLTVRASEMTEDDVRFNQLAKATAELSPLELWLVLARRGLHGHEPETLQSLADQLGLNREALRRRYVAAESRLGALVSET